MITLRVVHEIAGINKLAHFAKYIIARLGVVVASAAATVTRAPARLFPRARSRPWFFDPENLRCPCSPPHVEPLYFQEWRNGVNNTNGGKPDKNEFNLILTPSHCLQEGAPYTSPTLAPMVLRCGLQVPLLHRMQGNCFAMVGCHARILARSMAAQGHLKSNPVFRKM